MGQEEETKLNNIYQILISAELCLTAKEEELILVLKFNVTRLRHFISVGIVSQIFDAITLNLARP